MVLSQGGGAPVAPFRWRDGEREIAFGRGAAAEAVELLGGPGYALLTTERASSALPAVVEAAGAVHHVRPGLVDELSAELLDAVAGERIVALGGGRVVDVAKAVVAARRAGAGAGAGAGPGGAPAPGRAMAIPTTLSGAEMTATHRQARGVSGARGVRPAVVVADPELMASQPLEALAASALNALAHAAEGPCTPRANPVATLAGLEGARLLVSGFRDRERDPDRDALALGALLAGYTIDSQGYGLHHVMAQTMVRTCGVPHGAANAVLLPVTLGALAWRFPDRHRALQDAIDEDPVEAAIRIRALTSATSLRELGVPDDGPARCAEIAAQRTADLGNTPPQADRAELQVLYENAY